MNAGKLRRKIDLQTAAFPRTSFGATSETYTSFATVFASIEPLGGRELIIAQQNQSETTHNVTIRYHAGVTSSMRVKYGTRYFRILSVINLEERNHWMQLQCKELEIDQP